MPTPSTQVISTSFALHEAALLVRQLHWEPEDINLFRECELFGFQQRTGVMQEERPEDLHQQLHEELHEELQEELQEDQVHKSESK
jgi:hypothetical protein